MKTLRNCFIFVACLLLAGCATSPAPTASTAPKVITDRRLDGEWKSVSATINGNPLPQKTIDILRLTFTENRFITKRGDETLFDSAYRVETKTEPRHIFMMGNEGQLTGREASGIYKLEKDNLFLCYSMPGDPTPTDFSSAPGSKAYLTIWTRKK